jgi:hypothetical protein
MFCLSPSLTISSTVGLDLVNPFNNFAVDVATWPATTLDDQSIVKSGLPRCCRFVIVYARPLSAVHSDLGVGLATTGFFRLSRDRLTPISSFGFTIMKPPICPDAAVF